VSLMHNSNNREQIMAKIIVKQHKNDKILQLISWKEIIQIYFQSLLILVYIVVRNALLSIKNYCDKRFGATRQKFVRQFYVLSSNTADNCNGSNAASNNKAICPATQNPELGEHKYIKIKVSTLCFVRILYRVFTYFYKSYCSKFITRLYINHIFVNS
jgi:hypothetical protein